MKGETYYEKDRRKSNELPQLRMLSVRVFFLIRPPSADFEPSENGFSRGRSLSFPDFFISLN